MIFTLHTAVYDTETVASFHFRFLLYLALDLNLLPFAFLASGLSSRPSEKLPPVSYTHLTLPTKA